MSGAPQAMSRDVSRWCRRDLVSYRASNLAAGSTRSEDFTDRSQLAKPNLSTAQFSHSGACCSGDRASRYRSISVASFLREAGVAAEVRRPRFRSRPGRPRRRTSDKIYRFPGGILNRPNLRPNLKRAFSAWRVSDRNRSCPHQIHRAGSPISYAPRRTLSADSTPKTGSPGSVSSPSCLSTEA